MIAGITESRQPALANFKSTDLCYNDKIGNNAAMDSDRATVTKAPIDVLKTVVIFTFPALGGLLFGTTGLEVIQFVLLDTFHTLLALCLMHSLQWHS